MVGNAKSSDTNVNDVIKTSANFDGVRANYNEAYRALTASDAKQNKHEIKSYELIIPYLQKLKEKNENSVLAYKRLADKSISQIFFVQVLVMKTFIVSVLCYRQMHVTFGQSTKEHCF